MITNDILLREMNNSKGQLTPELGKLFMELVHDVASRRPEFFAFVNREDLEADAVLCLCKHWHKFNQDRSSDPLSYFTVSIIGSFTVTINQQRRAQINTG